MGYVAEPGLQAFREIKSEDKWSDETVTAIRHWSPTMLSFAPPAIGRHGMSLHESN